MSRVVSVPYPAGISNVVLLRDAFTGSDGTELSAHTPEEGGPWIDWGGSIQLSSNTAVIVTDGTYAADCGRSDVTIACRIKCGAANGNFAPSIVLRGSNDTHYLIVYFSGDGNLQLYWRHGGAFDLLATTTWSADANWHDVVVTTDGTNISVIIDGGAPWETFSMQQAAGTFHGIRGFQLAGSADAFDTILIDAVPAIVFPAPYSNVLDSEDFNAANGTTLASRGWTVGNGTWTCQTNQGENADVDGDAQGYTVYRDEVTGDCAIEVVMTTPSSGQMIGGLSFRVQDSTHFIEIELNTSTTYTPQRGFGCWYTNGGAFIELMTSHFVPASNTPYTIRVTCVGTRITCEVVEAGLIMSTDSAQFQAETEFGLFEYRDGTRPNPNRWDSFVVYD